MIKYQVRSKDLIDMVNDINAQRLILSPFFQRNLVWREIHKHDFIETIQRGYPFPQIFIARGDIDVDTMTSQSCVVDGQQRMNAIMEFITNRYPVNGRLYKDLDQEEKEVFLKYQIPVIDLEMKATDPSVIDIFQRLNRTFYSLSTIEKMSTEYSSVDFMLISKFLCGFFKEDPEREDSVNQLENDPNMPVDFIPWTRSFDVNIFTNIITNGRIFSGHENSRMVHLMWTLNYLSTIRSGFFNRNDKTKQLLESDADLVLNREMLIGLARRAATVFSDLQFPQESMWWNKSNSFSLMILLSWHIDVAEQLDSNDTRQKLEEFERNVSEEYALAAREAVNNLRQRKLRHNHLAECLGFESEERPLEPV